MHLDQDYAVSILEALQEHPSVLVSQEALLLTGEDVRSERYHYHSLMLKQQGLIEIWPPMAHLQEIESAVAFLEGGGTVWRDRPGEESEGRLVCWPLMLTYEGHRFLDVMQSETLREKVKAFVESKGIPFTLSFLKDALPAFLKETLG